MTACFYAWPDIETAETEGAMIDARPAPGWTDAAGPVWLTRPVIEIGGEGEPVLVTPGQASDPVVLVRTGQAAALAHRRITPDGHAGLA
ncbi:MAG: hypothetical protein ABL308_10745 [Oceanicaulis sp.]